ncbi:MAG: hypothetical protein ACPHCN_12970 [Mycobacterium sp.]
MALAFSDRGSLLMTQALASVSTSVTTTGGIEGIRYRTGAQPSQSGTITSAGTLLATFTILEADMTASGNEVTIAAAESTTAAATGTIGHFEAVDGGDNVLFVGSVATSGADINVDNTSLTSGQTVNLNTFTFSIPQGS